MNNYILGKKKQHLPSKNLQQRLTVIMALLTVGFVIILFRLLNVALSHQSVTKADSEESQVINSYSRKSIVDANGTLLAVNLTTASLYADPKMLLDIDEVIKSLKAIFPSLDKEKLKLALTSSKRFVWIKRNLTPLEQEKVNQAGIPGLYFKDDESRIYPHGNLVSHILGFTNVDWHGIAGVEKYFDDFLINKDNLVGKDKDQLNLSIDVRVQDVLYQALLAAKEKYKAEAAGGIVMDVNSGQIVAMVSLPDFDPHNPGKASDSSKFNRMTLGVYEMGSTFKALNMALAFDANKINMDNTYDVSEPIRIAKFKIKDYHPFKGRLSVPEIFIESSNIGSVHIVEEVGEKGQKEFLEKMGMLKATEIELPEKSRTLYPKEWSKISMMTISYGHGIAVTPVHVVQAVAALVNGGKFYPATLLKTDMRRYKQVVRKETSDKLRKLMRYVVAYGTGKNANVEGYLVGGKTGSADKPTNGGYGNKNSIISSFVGAFPMNDPKYVVFAMVDDPKRSKADPFVTGGVVAAPIVGSVIEQIAPILEVSPVDPNDDKIRREFWYDNEAGKKHASL